ncbi:paraflagellar rod protein [Angomonas deanei]|uniref:Uncharacterized protein n=1 Tax=Angomonas deanei TaxID=59799 RepID=A0A7G2CQR0_9TRYP|nr:paraflagellar rod protein [Angomonas deanei]CAD2221477.1 hypothetical protein, conserved [Angomonas deanei]|eukprot:EPY43607.1 paraflagellar rod protein [Angomonas deanei]
MTAVDHNGPTGLSDSIQNNSATVDTLKNSTNNNLTNNNNNNNNASVKNAFQRSKKTYLEEEEQLERIVYHNNNLFSQHFQNFLDKTIASLDIQFEKCEALLQELQQQSNLNNTTNNNNNNNTYWNSKTIIEHCNLHMSEKRLIRYQLAKNNNNNHAEVPLGIEDAPKSGVNPNNNNNNTNENEVTSLSKLIQLISVIEKIRSTSFATPKQKAFLDRCVEKLRVVHYEPRDFLSIVNALQVKLQDDGKTKTVFTDLTNFQNNIENLTPEIQKCENLLEMSIKNGEMGLAESISKRQLELYEHTLSLITEQYPTLHQHF